jgi:peptidoglycan/LPS O-acetylase OafA/YrhL
MPSGTQPTLLEAAKPCQPGLESGSQQAQLQTVRNSQLDVLRGLAVLAVMFCHYPCYPWFDSGSASVDLFFVLSGFLISGLLFTDWKRNGEITLSRFFVRRGFKIYPRSIFSWSSLCPCLSRCRN